MSEKAARWIFWVGTLVSLGLLVGLTVDTHSRFAALTHADKLDAQVVAGKRAFEARNCNDCHTVLGFGSYYAPDLTRAYDRLGDAGIQSRLQFPETAFSDSFRKMPQQHLSAQEVADITAYLRWISNIENHDWPPQDSSRRWTRSAERLVASGSLSPGGALIDQGNCLSCHSLGSAGAHTAPHFEWIGSRHSSEWIATYLFDPAKSNPHSQMPAYANLTGDERRAIGDFIVAAAANAGR